MPRTFFRTLYGVYALVAFVVVILLFFCPLLIAAPSLKLRRAIGRLAVRAWLASIFVRLRVRGLHNLPAAPCVVVCNHASYVDGIVLTAALPGRFTFLVQHGAEKWPYVGLIISRMGVAFVNRDSVMKAALALRRFIRMAQAGASLAIFPEGGFVEAPGLQPFYGGAFLVAARAGVPVVPAVMRGSRRFFAENQAFPSWSSLEIELFAPITGSAAARPRQEAETLSRAARTVIARHCGEAAPAEAESFALPSRWLIP